MTKLSFPEADFILINITKLIVMSADSTERTIAENIRDKILDDYDNRISRSKKRTQNLKDHLEILKDKIK
tara:strand:- start:442 stop:651 length:210 start_codon:yes stop_codon:yes gene_type:complete